MTPPLLSIKNLTVTYQGKRGSVTAVDDVSLTLHAGQVLGIVGESGSGKSTLGLALMGLLPKTASVSGSITINGVEITTASQAEINALRGRTMGLVYQDALAALNPVRTVGGQLAEGIKYHRQVNSTIAKQDALRIMGQVGINEQERRFRQYPGEFSGGMRQRMAIAMAIAAEPKLLVADEPTTALDVTVQAQILRLLRQITNDRGTAMLVISHDLDVISELTDDVAVMYHGRLIENGKTAVVLGAPQHHYTAALMKTAPSVARPIISFIPGAPPAAGIAITGCSFEPRCRFGKGRDVCLALRPLLHNVDGNGHAVACHFPGAELNADAAAIAAETSGTIHHAGGDAHAPHGGQ